MKKIEDVERDWMSEVEEIQQTFKKRAFKIHRPQSEFPEIDIRLPDSLDTIELAPLYDVHIGSREHDGSLLAKHLKWISETPNVFTFNGGDAYENVTDFKMGPTPMNPEEQLFEATKKFATVQHKMMFSIPGNHEDRTFKHAGMSGAKRLADNLQVPYFGDYCFANLKWRGNTFRLLAHHGSGGAGTPGAQRNSARKDLTWSKPDILWTGHLHQTLADTVYTTDYDQKTGRIYERGCAVIISPSYLKYFGGYAAKMRLAPGLRGLTVAILQEDGRIDVNLHARGKRL
jgi:hypothetical protein